MALLERVTQMKQRGMPESQIAKALMEEGNYPAEIQEAISQSKIKAAVGIPPAEQPAEAESSGSMQQSIMQSQPEEMQAPAPEQEQQYAEQPQESAQEQQYPNEQYPQYQEQVQYAQEYAQQPAEAGAYYQQAPDIETIRDIAKQIVEEELAKIKSRVEEMDKLKTELKFQVQAVENRLVKIEEIIQNIQSSILKKIGNYGEAISDIAKEVRATQDSFSKMINPIMDAKRGIKSPQQQSQALPNFQNQNQPNSNQPPSRPSKSKPTISFEDYLR